MFSSAPLLLVPCLRRSCAMQLGISEPRIRRVAVAWSRRCAGHDSDRLFAVAESPQSP
jgi:hypothetical protein